ncbi:hypothetical protein STCU_07151 [Strigomonas culicis]|uniref:Roadblock/LAMTOR2 domain-containing protein n=1 Tax=Strigomonas culicis TaxID=28005 RepID=S9VBV5_9TRYP|nr:hypothetical protein STCU_07151 [Strigomonas culicis]|eukprot:EPY24496.1 hypothetical protein STCU_07151 [Strigomonas culicis]
MASEKIEAVLEHVTYTKGVLGVVVCSREGEPIRDTFQSLDRSRATSLARMAAELARQAALILALEGESVITTTTTMSVTTTASGEKGDPKTHESKRRVPVLHKAPPELLRVRTNMYEIFVRCSEEFLLVVVQEPVD